MKLFTKIALGMAGFFLGIAILCLVIALGMGVRVSDVQTMLNDGKFSFGPEDGFHISFGDDNDIDIHLGNNTDQNKQEQDFGAYNQYYEDGYSCLEVSHVCTDIYLELGAGKLEIYYDDVANVQIRQKNVSGFRVSSSDEDASLHIGGDVDIVNNSGISLVLILPRDIKLEQLCMEIGACDAEISDIIAEEMTLVVGAGQAEIADVSLQKFELEVGAGEAIVENLSVQELDVKAGVGEVDIEIAGAETEYNYDVECGIGEVTVADRTFGGMGTAQKITHAGANNYMNVECGIGSVQMHFSCDITDGTCEDVFHNHSHYNNHKNHH